MKTILLCIVMVFSTIASSQILGGEINYRCLGNDQYEAFVELSAPCSVNIATPQIYATLGATTVSADSMTLFEVLNTSTPGINCIYVDSCLIYNFRKYRYRGFFDFSGNSSCELRFFIKEPTTHFATTLTGRSFFYISTEVNRCLAPCDQSPDLKDYGPNQYAHNQDLITNLSVKNDSFPNDSFFYSVFQAREDSNKSASYSAPFSPFRWIAFFGMPNNNLSWPAGLHLDSRYCDIMFRPTQQNQIGTIVIQVAVYRKINGTYVQIGTKYIEKHFSIIASPSNKVPEILPPYSKSFCVGDVPKKECITVSTDDDDPLDTVSLYFPNKLIPAMEINNIGAGKHAKYEICFTPDSTHISSIPYTVLAIAKDNSCPNQGQATRSFSFFVRNPVNTDPKITLDTCGQLRMQETSPEIIWSQSHWRVQDSASQQFSIHTKSLETFNINSGTYYIESKFSNIYCSMYLYDTLRVKYPVYPVRVLSDQEFGACISEHIDFGNHVSEPDVDYLWSDGNTQAMRTITLGPDTPFLVLKSTRAYCEVNDTFRFISDSIPDSKFTAYWQDSSTLKGAVDFPKVQHTYQWTIKDSLTIPGPTFSVNNLDYQAVKVSLQATDRFCSSWSTTLVNPPPPPPPSYLPEFTSGSVYPNPFSKSISISYPGILGIRMLNALGQEIDVQVEVGSGNTLIIPGPQLPNGVYLLILETESGYFVVRVVKRQA